MSLWIVSPQEVVLADPSELGDCHWLKQKNKKRTVWSLNMVTLSFMLLATWSGLYSSSLKSIPCHQLTHQPINNCWYIHDHGEPVSGSMGHIANANLHVFLSLLLDHLQEHTGVGLLFLGPQSKKSDSISLKCRCLCLVCWILTGKLMFSVFWGEARQPLDPSMYVTLFWSPTPIYEEVVGVPATTRPLAMKPKVTSELVYEQRALRKFGNTSQHSAAF